MSLPLNGAPATNTYAVIRADKISGNYNLTIQVLFIVQLTMM